MLTVLKSVCDKYPNHVFNQQSEDDTLRYYFQENVMPEPQGALDTNLSFTRLAKHFYDRVKLKTINTLLSEWNWVDDVHDKEEM